MDLKIRGSGLIRLSIGITGDYLENTALSPDYIHVVSYIKDKRTLNQIGRVYFSWELTIHFTVLTLRTGRKLQMTDLKRETYRRMVSNLSVILTR